MLTFESDSILGADAISAKLTVRTDTRVGRTARLHTNLRARDFRLPKLSIKYPHWTLSPQSTEVL